MRPSASGLTPDARRLALGTAQFGMHYGLANVAGPVEEIEAARMLAAARSAGMCTVDTAIAYGSSEVCLGNVGVKSWEVVTKLPALPTDASAVGQWLDDQLRASMARLRLEHIPVLLLHRPSDLLGKRGDEYLQALHGAKSDGAVGELGISIYAPQEIDAIWPIFKPDVVQAPFNVLDRRLRCSGWLDRLQHARVRVMSRSVFLQGLLLMRREVRPPYFEPWADLLDKWLDWCTGSGMTPLQGALRFALGHTAFDRVVVGADSLAQLDEILAAVRGEIDNMPADLYSEDLALIEPSRWRLG